MSETYYLLQVSGPEWNGGRLAADMLDEMSLPDAGRFSLPEPVLLDAPPTFAIQANEPRPDLLDCSCGGFIWLISSRFAAFLKARNVRFETLPVRMLDFKTDQEFDAGYSLFHLLDCRPGLDPERSVLSPDGRSILRLALRPEILQEQPVLFRDSTRRILVYVHRRLADEILAQGFTGFDLTPASEFQFKLKFPGS